MLDCVPREAGCPNRLEGLTRFAVFFLRDTGDRDGDEGFL